MAVVVGRIGAGVGQKVLFRDSSPRGSEQHRPFCILFICFLFTWLFPGIYLNQNLRHGGLIGSHNCDQIRCGDLYLLSDDSSTDH